MRSQTIQNLEWVRHGALITPCPKALTRQLARDFYQDCVQLLDPWETVSVQLDPLVDIDSAGLGALLELNDHYRDGGGITVLTTSAPWLILLEITRMDSMLAINPATHTREQTR